MNYRNLSSYFRDRFGGKTVKICIDGGFTCPNRDGTCGTGGCIFCGERGSGEHIPPGDGVRKQVENFLARSDVRKPADNFVAYFQNFSNTYADLATLKSRYDQVFLDPRIRVLAVGTRPDCITPEIADLLAEYRQKADVWVELGLQSSSDETAERIHRGYKSVRFTEAARLLAQRGIEVVAHMILGLPGETLEDVQTTLRFLTRHKLHGVKIHSLYVMEGTQLAQMYRSGTFEPITEEEYITWAVSVLTHMPPEWVVHRLTGDCPANLLVAPSWNVRKNEILQQINARLEENGWKQGCFFESNTP